MSTVLPTVLQPSVIVIDALDAAPAWLDLLAVGGLLGVVVPDPDTALRRLEAMFAAGTDPDGFVIGPGVESPVDAALRLHAGAPYVQFVFIAVGGAADPLRRELALTPRLGSGWTIVPAIADEVAAAVRGAARASRRHRARPGI